MNTKNIVYTISLVALSVGILCPEVFGLDGGAAEYGGAILKAEGDKLKTLVKPALGIGGVAGLVMGGIQAFKQSAIGPLLTWFGIGAGGLAGYGLLGSSMFSAIIP
ncbi:MAG: hypothetical protein Q8Q56_02515 [Alphaproteobacteria bacterium]|nr:hypothetical protein [Alphaproteobacteria bacterium]